MVLAGDKPFDIGDRVIIDGHDGIIEEIGLRSTRLRSHDGHLVTIPNGILSNLTITNITERPYLKRLLDITVTYDTSPAKLKEAKKILELILKDHEGMNPDYPPRVFFSDYNPDSLNIRVIYWYFPADYWKYIDFSEKVNFEILSQYNEAGIEFAFPTQTVHIKPDSSESREF